MFAQAPQKMSYQAVIRNSANNLVTNAPVKMRISILQGSASGTTVYSELHNPTTNANGLVSIEIGSGTSPVGTIGSINWGNGTYFLKTETDPTNATNYSIVGTSQLLSVPYALNAKCVDLSVSPIGDSVKIGCSSIILPGASKSNFEPKISNGLVGYWPFNGNANDESGNGNHGIVNGATLTTDRFGNANKAYSFNGVNKYTSVPNFPINFNSFTLSFWVNLKNDFQVQRIISHKWDCDNNTGAIGSHINNNNSDNKFKVGLNIRSTIDIQSQIWDNSVPVLNQWVFYSITFTNNLLTFYKNGIVQSQVVTTNGLKQVTNTLFFGGDECGQPYFGLLDDIRIYNRTLTQEEITYLANN